MSAFIDTPRHRAQPKPPPTSRTRDERPGSTINIHVHSAKPAAVRHADAKAAVSKVVAQLAALGRRVDAAGSKFGKVADRFDGVADTAHRMADSRRALGFRGRV